MHIVSPVKPELLESDELSEDDLELVAGGRSGTVSGGIPGKCDGDGSGPG